jgi:hypothetical protein
MDRRRNERFEVDQEVSVTLLGDRELTMPGKLVNLSGRGLGLEVREPLAAGSAVKIDSGDNLFVGEVVYCKPSGARFQAGIELQEAIRNVSGLRELMEQLFAGVGEGR